jgi:DNA-binding IclR family transcriptional regulator
MTGKALRSIKSAHRVLEILEYFDRDHRTATVMDLSRSLSYPQSSTSELLRCLTRLGYLHYNRVRRTYSPTARVALLGSWVEPTLFRGGTVLSALDRVADRVGETVVLSSSANYVVQHLHVVDGRSEHAVIVHAGDGDPQLHCPQGELLLASYQDVQIKSALHRINAEEQDARYRVRIAEKLEELTALRRKGWLIRPDTGADDVGAGIGVVAILLPRRKGSDRLVLSVLAPREVIEEHGEEILQIMMQERDYILPREEERAPQSLSMLQPVPAMTPCPMHA